MPYNMIYNAIKNMKLHFKVRTCAWADNTAAIAVAVGSDLTRETVKHVTVKERFLQECVRDKIVLLLYIKTCKKAC